MVNQTMLEFMLMVSQIIFFLLLRATCYDTKTLNGLSLKMIHRDSPDSPMYRANLTDTERMENYIEMSIARVRSVVKSHVFKNKSLTSLKPNDIIIRPTMSEHGSYLVQIGIGTFEDQYPTSKTYHLGLDTGSQLTWIQCEGCEHCFPQLEPYFPAARSSTYQPFPCANCPPGAQCQHNNCLFQMRYLDGGQVVANAAKEVFTFASEGGRSQPIVDVIFGCGIDMRNFIEETEPNNNLCGILGMGFGFYGFMEQTELIFGGKFSYCLQSPLNHGRNSPMYLRFGNDALPQHMQGMQSTPIYRFQDHQMYHLELESISVDGQKLGIHPNYFAINSDGSGGCIIDSGTVFSFIVKGAYEIFKKAIKDSIKSNNNNVRQLRTPLSGYNLCYKRSKGSQRVNLPIITFHFENNADFVIGVTESFYIGTQGANEGVICMNYLEDDHKTVLGVLQQVNKRIIYDRRNELLHFAPADCSREN